MRVESETKSRAFLQISRLLCRSDSLALDSPTRTRLCLLASQLAHVGSRRASRPSSRTLARRDAAAAAASSS